MIALNVVQQLGASSLTRVRFMGTESWECFDNSNTCKLQPAKQWLNQLPLQQERGA
jgi:hypothetical protein